MSLKIISLVCLIPLMFLTSVGYTEVTKGHFPVDSVQGLQWTDRDARTMSLTLLALYPNGCYRLVQTLGTTSPQEMKVYLEQSVAIADGLCTQAIVPQTDEATIFFPHNGQYEIIDSTDLKLLGWVVLDEEGFSFRAAKK